MKLNLVRVTFMMAIACLSLVVMESQADAFFGRFRNRGACGGHHRQSSCFSHGWGGGCASSCAPSCAPVSRCAPVSDCAPSDCGACASDSGCQSSCDRGCGLGRLFGRRHHKSGCGGCQSACDSGCGGGGGCDSGCGGGCGGEVIYEGEVESAPSEPAEAAPEAPADEDAV